MRRLLLFLFSIGLIGAGGYVFYLGLAHPSIYVIARFGLGAGFLVFIGGYLLWDDFIRPCLPAHSKQPLK